MTTATDAEALARAVAFARAGDAAAAQRADPHPWGVALHDAAHPNTYVLNGLLVDGALPADVEARTMAAELERLFGDLGHRRVVFDDDATAQRLATGLRGHGYTCAAEVTMLLDGEPDRRATLSARECPEAELRAVEQAFLLEEGRPAPIAAEVLDARAAMCATRPQTRFFVASLDGRDVASATLHSDGTIAQIEDVGALTAARGHGLGRAVVTAAADAAVAAGHELVFIVADQDDWPKDLYAKLGFRSIGRSWTCLREVRKAA